ncbi:shikimate kinase [Puteibacter caeruleilacunae]|nr:shikimate kinase [Puteibacter caeruleilacunae]
MRIYLIGYMGSGKTTLGRRLAEMLNLSFLDMDKFIEEKYFRSIPQIFAEEGEDGFRDKEHKALKEVAGFHDVIISTGGGAPCFFDNMDIMNNSGVTFYLDIPADELAKRLMKSKNERPLIKGKSEEELIAFIDETLRKRNEFYKQAHYCVYGRNIQPEEIIEHL